MTMSEDDGEKQTVAKTLGKCCDCGQLQPLQDGDVALCDIRC